VAECIFTIAGGDDSGARGIYNSGKKVIGLDLDILGEALNFRIGVGKDRARLADIVPLARILCDRITDVVVRKKCGEGNHIPCRKGCSACCSRYLVPLSVPEALRLNEEIEAEPAYQRESILRACLRAARLILKQKPPKTLTLQIEQVYAVKSVDLYLVSNWYTSLKLACPFLYNQTCSIYSQRPLSCREYFLTGSATVCEGRHDVAEVLDMPVHLPNVLGQLASELEGTGVEAIILPLVPVWCEENSERTKRSWPAEIMVKRFVDIVEATAEKNLAAVAPQRQTVIGSSKKRRATSRLYQSSSY
jgi:Fe-S-cluster containining protein